MRAFIEPTEPGSDLERREFLKICCMAAAAVGLPSDAAAKFLQQVERGLKPSVIWLANQECTGCSESLLRTNHPNLAKLLLDLISLDYHETLCAAAGEQVEEARLAAMDRHAGEYILVVEGAIPTRDGGVYCMIGDHTSLELVQSSAERAGAIIAIGSCASWGGIPSSYPNPTGAAGVPQVLPGETVVTIPGCPPNPYNFLGTVLQFATFGTLPALDALGRPKFAYDRTIHEHCPRRPHFDAGRFAKRFGDEGHRLGYCLYELGCKGPQTHANCPTHHFGEVVGAWPIGIGHPCFGCTERHIAFNLPVFATIDIEEPTPPASYPPITPERGGVSPVATAVGGAVLGGAIAAGLVASRKLSAAEATATGGSGKTAGGDGGGGNPGGGGDDGSGGSGGRKEAEP